MELVGIGMGTLWAPPECSLVVSRFPALRGSCAGRSRHLVLKKATPCRSACSGKWVSYHAYASWSKGKFFPIDCSTSSISDRVIDPYSNSIRPISLCCPFSISSHHPNS
jgi:hypothetical protein